MACCKCAEWKRVDSEKECSRAGVFRISFTPVPTVSRSSFRLSCTRVHRIGPSGRLGSQGDWERQLTWCGISFLICFFQSSSLPVFQSSSLPVFQSSSLPVFQSSSLPVFKSSSLQVFKSSSLQVSKSPSLKVSQSSFRLTARECIDSPDVTIFWE